MQKTSFIIAIIVLSQLNVAAQHCPWDGSSFVMLDLKIPASASIQKIYLLDSAGTKVISKRYYGNELVVEDSAVFWKNPRWDPKDGPYQGKVQHFSFAKEYYVLSFGQYQYNMRYQVMIVYTDSKTDNTLRLVIPLPKTSIHPLCTLNKELWGGETQPVQIVL